MSDFKKRQERDHVAFRIYVYIWRIENAHFITN